MTERAEDTEGVADETATGFLTLGLRTTPFIGGDGLFNVIVLLLPDKGCSSGDLGDILCPGTSSRVFLGIFRVVLERSSLCRGLPPSASDSIIKR